MTLPDSKLVIDTSQITEDPGGKMRLKFLCLMLAVGFMGVFAAPTRAENFTANLTGAQEVPPAATNATGYARVFLNETAGTISFTVVFNGFSMAQTAAHIHTGAIGVSGPVTIGLGTVGGTSGTISGTVAITPAQIALLRSHQFYVNVHSGTFTGGEIRGQLGITRVVDYDGDGRTDYSVLRFPNIAPPGVANINWWNLNSTTGPQVINSFGDANRDFPTPGDYDGDGTTDIAIYRSGTQSEFWILLSANNVLQYFAWGLIDDQPIPRDYDGDGITDVAVFRAGAAVQATWYIRNSATATARVEAFGLSGDGTNTFDTPVPGDYDGDGKFDLAVYRFGLSPQNNYIVKQSSNGAITYRQFGNFNTDYILPGDYDGDGKYDYAVARTGATGTSPMVWWILQSSTGTTRTQTWGRTSDFPVQGDYDGDARTDLAIYRAGATAAAQSNYWVLRSFDNTAQVQTWGLGSDFSVNRYDSR